MCFVTLFDCCESKQTNKPRKNESKSKTQVQFGASLLELEWNRNGTNWIYENCQNQTTHTHTLTFKCEINLTNKTNNMTKKKGIGALARQAQESYPRPGSSRWSRDGDLGGSVGDEREPNRRDGEGCQPVGERAASTAAADAAAARPLGAFNRTIQSDHSSAADGHSVSTGCGGSGGGRPTLPSQSRQQRSNSSAQRRGKSFLLYGTILSPLIRLPFFYFLLFCVPSILVVVSLSNSH